MIFGWQFFGTVLLLLLLSGWFFRDNPVVRRPLAAHGRKPAGARGVIWLAVIVLLLAGPALAARLATTTNTAETAHLTAPKVPGWTRSQPGAEGWQPAFEGAAGQVLAAYRSGTNDGVVELFHAVYVGKPRRGHNLITFGNNVYDPARSHILSSAGRKLELADGHRLEAGELRLAGASGSRLVWYWYCVDRRCTRSPALTKLVQAWDVLRGRVPQSSVWALSTPIGTGGVGMARASLRVFAHSLLGSGASVAPEGHGSGGNVP
jgi:EpsI family protein